MIKRDTFIFYRSFYEAIISLPKEDQCLMFKAIADYSLDGIESELEGINKVVWTLIKPQLDANLKRFVNGKKGAEYGSKGGRPKLVKGENNPIGVIGENPSGVILKTPNNNNNINNNNNKNENKNINKNESDSEKPNTHTPKKRNRSLTNESESTFEERRITLMHQVAQFKDQYPSEMLRDFYNYWSEKVQNRWLMRIELEKTFEMDRRLIKWKANDRKFKKDEGEVSLRKSFN